jgi:vesicle coat complex subunit
MVSTSCLVSAVSKSDIFLSHTAFVDVLLVNQTPNTLQNLCLDFATLGDLKLVERPGVYTIAPHGFQSIKATIKVLPFLPSTSPYTDPLPCAGLFH